MVEPSTGLGKAWVPLPTLETRGERQVFSSSIMTSALVSTKIRAL